MSPPESVTTSMDRQQAFARQVREPDANHFVCQDPRRMSIYQELVLNANAGFINDAFPVCKSLVEAQQWQQWIRDFLIHARSKSPYFRDISQTFMDWLPQHYSNLPDWLPELLHYEWIELALDTHPADPFASAGNAPDGELTDGLPTDVLTLQPHWSELAWLLSYVWPVHTLCSVNLPESPPEQHTWLLVYRNRQQRIAFMLLNQLTVELIRALQSGKYADCRTLLYRVAATCPQYPEQTLLDGGLATLMQFHQQGAISHFSRPTAQTDADHE